MFSFVLKIALLACDNLDPYDENRGGVSKLYEALIDLIRLGI